jgi:hypothetical protein
MLTPDDEFSRLKPITYFPVFTIIEFIAYLGWIKVAETLLYPWGDDDEDFQVNYVIDRNIQTSMLIVDDAITEVPIAPDVFMNVGVPSSLPYYNASGSGHSNNGDKNRTLVLPNSCWDTCEKPQVSLL